MLSGVFFMLTLLAYVSYVRQRFSIGRYALVVVLFAMGLMAKSMLVTLPFLLLLLDYWPLNRFASLPRPAASGAASGGTPIPRKTRIGRWWRRPPVAVSLIIEKLPLIAITVVDCVILLLVQKKALGVNARLPLSWRIGDALIAYITYLEKFFYPVDLNIVYPRLETAPPVWNVVGAVAILLCVTIAVVLLRRKRPYLAVGWFWYLGMFVPVIGFLQVGLTAIADRFTYLPQIGIAIALTWGAADLFSSWRWRRWLYGAIAVPLLVFLMVCAMFQASYWCDSETLWNRTIEQIPNNTPAHNNLGRILLSEGRMDEAMEHFKKALDASPGSEIVQYNMGYMLATLGRDEEAREHLLRSIEINPDTFRRTIAWVCFWPNTVSSMMRRCCSKGRSNCSAKTPTHGSTWGTRCWPPAGATKPGRRSTRPWNSRPTTP